MTQKMQTICPVCGKVIKVGINFCTNCGADLMEQSTIVPVSRIPTQSLIIDKEWTHLKQLIEEKKNKAIVKYIRNLIKRYSNDNNSLKNIYDLIGRMLIQNSEFFRKNIYLPLYEKCVHGWKRVLYPQQTSAMEQQILRKFCLYKGEKLITCCFGKVIIGIHEIHGNFYATEHRLIANGVIRRKSVGAGGGGGGPGDVVLIVLIAIFELHKFLYGLKSPWKKRLKKEFNEIKPCFGFEFPYINVHHIKEKKTRTKFLVKYEYEHKRITKTKTPKLGVVPLKGKHENKKDFQKRREMFLSEFNKILKSNTEKM